MLSITRRTGKAGQLHSLHQPLPMMHPAPLVVCLPVFYSFKSLLITTILRHIPNSQKFTDGERAAELGQNLDLPFSNNTFLEPVAHAVLTWAGRLPPWGCTRDLRPGIEVVLGCYGELEEGSRGISNLTSHKAIQMYLCWVSVRSWRHCHLVLVNGEKKLTHTDTTGYSHEMDLPRQTRTGRRIQRCA